MSARAWYTRNGRVSTSKIWRHVAYSLASYVIFINAKGLSPELLLVYLAVVAGAEIAKIVVANKYPTAGGPNANP